MYIEIAFIIEQYIGNGIQTIANNQVFLHKQHAEDLKNELSNKTKNTYRIKRLQII